MTPNIADDCSHHLEMLSPRLSRDRNPPFVRFTARRPSIHNASVLQGGAAPGSLRLDGLKATESVHPLRPSEAGGGGEDGTDGFGGADGGSAVEDDGTGEEAREVVGGGELANAVAGEGLEVVDGGAGEGRGGDRAVAGRSAGRRCGRE